MIPDSRFYHAGNMKQDRSGLYYIFHPNKGVWVLILVHLFILFALVFLFSAIIQKMQGF